MLKPTSLAALAAIVFLSACPWPIDEPSTSSGFTSEGPSEPPPDLPAPVLECPGETMCPCVAPGADESGGDADEEACPGPVLECGPHGACTSNCAFDEHCTSGVSGEACLGGGEGMAGKCAVPCNPEVPHGGCPMAEGVQSECVFVLNTWVCGY